MSSDVFKTPLARTTFYAKYAQGQNDTWDRLCTRLVNDVCADLMTNEECGQLLHYMCEMKFIPGGRYLYYAGRPLHFYNNCFCLKAEEDTREEWGRLLRRASDCLMSGGGIGVDYSIIRAEGKRLKRTGGVSSGPIPLMQSINEVGRNVMQGGSRRSAMLASLNWQHGDIEKFLRIKNWPQFVRDLKEQDFNFPAPLDMTNVSINWDTDFAMNHLKGLLPESTKPLPKIWYDSVRQMCKTGEPGHCYNFYNHEKETLRNACGEFISENDSDVCNLGSINLGNIESIAELADIVDLASKFLVCGTLRGDLPYDKVISVREKNRKIGLGLMGIHEWLLKRNKSYEVDNELKEWLHVYKAISEDGAKELCDRLSINRPKRYRAIAPAGTIGILASTTTGIEPLFAVAYKRRYLEGKSTWKYQYVIDATADRLIKEYGLDPEEIETAQSLMYTPEKRIKFQADVQDYVDMGISSTLNLPAWGTSHNNDETCRKLADGIARYCYRLRGLTAYPDGARGGQPLTAVSYKTAKENLSVVYEENEEACKGGVCGV